MQLTSDEREFRFNSGFSVRVLKSFSSRLYQLSMAEWGRQNPPPPVPVIIEEVPWANSETGTRQMERPDADNPSYVQAMNVWAAGQEQYARNYLNQHVDLASLDSQVVEVAVAEMSKGDLKADPVSAFLAFVHDPGDQPGTQQLDPKSKDPIPDTGLSELGQFYKWMREIDSGDGALIERYMHLFRSGDHGHAGPNEDGVAVAGNAAGPAWAQPAATIAPPSTLNGDGGGTALGG